MSDYMDVSGSSDEISDEMYFDDIDDLYPSEPPSAQEMQELRWELKYINGEYTSSTDENEMDVRSIDPFSALKPSAKPYDIKKYRIEIQNKLRDVGRVS